MKIVFKIMASLISMGAGFAASKLVDGVWSKTTGTEPPKDSENLEHSLRAVLTFAVVSAAISAVIQALANRGAQKAVARYNKSRDMT